MAAPPTDSRLLFSDRALPALPLRSAGQRIVRDQELRGFFVVIGKTTKTVMVHGDLSLNGARQSIRVKVGEVGKRQTREARARAKRILGAITDGIDPRPQRPTPKTPETPSNDRP